jgi:translation initiation factor IF-1
MISCSKLHDHHRPERLALFPKPATVAILQLADKVSRSASRKLLQTGAIKFRPNHPHRFARCTNKYQMPVQDDVIEIEGRITSVLAGTMFRVELANKHLVLAHISGRMRKSFIRLTTGDRVKLEMSPYDLSKARIVYRLQG